MPSIFNPATQSDPSPAAATRRRGRKAAWWLALWVGLAGAAATGVLWRDASQRTSAAAQARFEYHTERIRMELEHRLESYETALKGAAGLIGARAGFDRTQWHRYFAKSSIDEHYPGRLLIGFAPRVPRSQKLNHELIARSEGLPNYAVRSAGGATRQELLPLAFIHSAVPKPPIALGDDLADDPVAAAAMSHAGRTGRTVMAGPLSASAGPQEENPIWGIFVPVYGGAGVPATDAERQRELIGYMVEAFNAMDTAGSALGPDARLIGLKVRDGEHPVFTCTELTQELARGFTPTRVRDARLRYGERDWSLHFVALPGYLSRNETDRPDFVLAYGALVSLLLAGLAGTMANRRTRALELVAERTAELSSALARSEASESRTRAVVDNALDAIITINVHGIIESFNPAAEQIFGYAQSEMVGQPVNRLMPSPDRERHDDYLKRYLSTGERRIIGIGRLVTGQRKNGACFPLELGVNEMRIGGALYFCGIVRDVTERHEASQALQRERELLEVRVAERTKVLTQTNAALQQEIVERRRIEGELVAAREQAMRAADAKAGFLANMSHEIRTPMNAVIGMTALLEETPLNAEQRDYVGTIHTSGDALLTVINDILDFSKIDSGKLELEHRPFELSACIEEAVDMLAPRAAEKGIELLYLLADDVPAWLVGDATRLRQVFVNLLSNAVKFTDRGEVCLSASLVPAAGLAPKLQFTVRDTGIGIPAAQQPNLFNAFTQADSSTTRKYGGTGLGLAICQQLVQLMGGTIGIESTEGQGSTVTFTIAAEVGVEGARPARRLTDIRPELTGKRVLVVDDNATNLRIIETQCRRWGMDVSTASSATQALAVLDGDRLFDLGVLDMHMPGMDGVQLAQQIRWLCPGSLPALVLLSSPSSDRGALGQLGSLFAAQLSKPAKRSQLFDTLIRVLHAQTADGPAKDSSRRLDRALAQRLPLRILVAEDSAINQKLAVGILSKLGYASDVADNGAQALELVRRNHYDLVFMDLQMPVMDGLECTRRIRRECPPGQGPRIVAMTANALHGDRERCLQAGMDDYIAKPVLPVDLQALIERMPRTVRPMAADEADEGPMIDRRTVDELREIDEPGQPSLLSSLLNDYLTETPAAIQDIRRFADRREAAHLAQRAHKLAGVSASLGACGVTEVCVQIERHIAAGDLTGLAAMIDQLERRFALTRTEFQRLV